MYYYLQGWVGQNLRRERKRLGLSQEAFADELGLHRTYVGQIERGERNLTLKTIERLAESLGVEPIVLFKKPDEPT